MAVYEIDGYQVIEESGWYYPMRWDAEMEDFVCFTRKDGWEVQFSDESQAIDYLATK